MKLTEKTLQSLRIEMPKPAAIQNGCADKPASKFMSMRKLSAAALVLSFFR